MTRKSPPLPPPPPPESFPIPFARQRSTDHRQYATDTSAYPQAGPPPGNNRPMPMPSPSTHTSQLYSSPQPPPPPPVRRSTRPPSNVTAPAPTYTPTFTTQPSPPYEYAPPPLAPQMSASISHHSSISDSGHSIPERPPFSATGSNASGPRPPQHLPTMPTPALHNTAGSAPYHHGSSLPNIVPPQSVRPEGSLPNTREWSYLEVHERNEFSSDSSDEEFVESPDSMSNSSGYRGQKGPTNPPYAGRRRRPRRRDTVPAPSSSQPPLPPPELEKCKLCPRTGPRHEWARLGHGGFCSERHKWQWEETYARGTAPANTSQAPPAPELEKCKVCPRTGPRHEWARLGHGGFCSERHKWRWEEAYARNTAPASTSQAPPAPELEKCRVCPSMGPRHEWARLGHSGFCSERHKWRWEETYAAHSNTVHRSRGPAA